MSTVPIPSPNELRRLYAGNPIIDHAEQALRAAGADTCASAEFALRTWRHTPELTDRERAAVLARFGGEPTGCVVVYVRGGEERISHGSADRPLSPAVAHGLADRLNDTITPSENARYVVRPADATEPPCGQPATAAVEGRTARPADTPTGRWTWCTTPAPATRPVWSRRCRRPA